MESSRSWSGSPLPYPYRVSIRIRNKAGAAWGGSGGVMVQGARALIPWLLAFGFKRLAGH